VYVALWTSHPYTLNTQNTRYPFFLSSQLAIPTFPSSPTTSLHSPHQNSTGSKAMISAIHKVPSRPKKTPAMTPLAPMPNQGENMQEKTQASTLARLQLLRSCSRSSSHRTRTRCDMQRRSLKNKESKKGIGQRKQDTSVRETFTREMRG